MLDKLKKIKGGLTRSRCDHQKLSCVWMSGIGLDCPKSFMLELRKLSNEKKKHENYFKKTQGLSLDLHQGPYGVRWFITTVIISDQYK